MSENQKSSLTGAGIAKNAFYGFSSWILPLGLNLIATPLIVSSLGYHEYGIYALVIGIINYSFAFNISRAVTKYVAQYRADDETEKIREIVAATFFVNIAISAVGLTAVFLFTESLISNVFQIEAGSRAKMALALYICATSLAFALSGQVFSALLQGLHRFDLYSKITNLSNIVLLSGNIGIAVTGGGLLALFWWNLIVTGLSFIVFYVFAKKLLPEISFFSKFSRKSLNIVLAYSGWLILYQVLANSLLIFERTWITRHMGTESLTFYVVPMMLSIQISMFVSSFILVIFPLASELRNETEKLARLYMKATKVVLFLVVFIAASVILQAREILLLWMGEDFAVNAAPLLIIHVISFSLISIFMVPWQTIEGLGYMVFNCFLFVICLVIAIPSMIYLSASLGNTGVAAGRLMGFSAVFFSIVFVEKKFFGKILAKFWLQILSRIFLATILMAAGVEFVKRQTNVSWHGLILTGLLGAAIYIASLWLLGFITDDEKQLFRRIIKFSNK